jgi:hypothetical protein
VSSRDVVIAEDSPQQVNVTGSNNLIRTYVGPLNSIIVTSANPQQGVLAAKGGPTMTHAIGTGSPAFDLGSNTQALQADQRGSGYLRLVGSAADIGAFEYQTVPPPSLPGDYSSNHFVDAADYVLWRKNLGSSVSQYTGADGDGSGVIDPGDYTVWRAHYGATNGAGAGNAVAVAPISPDAADDDVAASIPATAVILSSGVATSTSGRSTASRRTATVLAPANAAAHDAALLCVSLSVPRDTNRGDQAGFETVSGDADADAPRFEALPTSSPLGRSLGRGVKYPNGVQST